MSNTSSRKAGLSALLMVVWLLTALSPAYAGKTQRVRFKPGRTTAILNGTLPRGAAEYDAYLVRARKGQTLTVHLATKDPEAYVYVFASDLGPGEDFVSEDAGKAQDWSGQLPVSGDYSIQVYSDGRGGPYTLEITIR